VDDVLIAKDSAETLGPKSSYGGFSVGARMTLTPGTFWSDLVDEIRIYNRVVNP